MTLGNFPLIHVAKVTIYDLFSSLAQPQKYPIVGRN